ncbi:MAG: extensin family protein [Pseudomonadota bacterium]
MRAALLIAVLALPVAAEQRPVPRPEAPVVTLSTRGAIAVAPEMAAPARTARPVPRLAPETAKARAMAHALRDPLPVIDTAGLPMQSARPDLRPEDLLILASGARPRPLDDQGPGICGRASLRGETIAPVEGRGACGIPEAVRITSASGLGLSRPARMDCGTARALDDWVRDGVIPSVGGRGGGAVALQVAAGYACRTRNSQRGARISEHGKGRAIDISAIRLADGSDLNVLRDWGSGIEGRILRDLWRAACGPFGTVLGPESDRFHQDHFHFDTASYRSGPFCR